MNKTERNKFAMKNFMACINTNDVAAKGLIGLFEALGLMKSPQI